MSYNNYNRGSYSNDRNGNGNGGYGSQRGSYNNGQQRPRNEQQEKQFGSRFRIRGVVCTNKDTGEGFTRINMKNGGFMCAVNVMVKKYRNTGERDRDGRAVWNEDVEYYRLVAFRKNADDVVSMVKAKSIMDFSGDIYMRRLENGSYETSFVIDKIDMVKEFTGASNSQNQERRPSGDYQRSNGQRTVNYDDRPNNYSQSGNKNRGSETTAEDSRTRDDYAQPSNEDDIPF